jgi:hypothetical protein
MALPDKHHSLPAYLKGIKRAATNPSTRAQVTGALKRRNWVQARIWMGWFKRTS